jgi:hypothetical protein
MPEETRAASPSTLIEQARQHVVAARAIAKDTSGWWERVRNWWTGSSVETAWNHCRQPVRTCCWLRKRILNAITRLAQDAELTGDVKRLRGSHEYRVRVGDLKRIALLVEQQRREAVTQVK